MESILAVAVFEQLGTAGITVARDIESGKLKPIRSVVFQTRKVKPGDQGMAPGIPGCAIGHCLARAIGVPVLPAGTVEKSVYRALTMTVQAHYRISGDEQELLNTYFRHGSVQSVLNVQDRGPRDLLAPAVSAMAKYCHQVATVLRTI